MNDFSDSAHHLAVSLQCDVIFRRLMTAKKADELEAFSRLAPIELEVMAIRDMDDARVKRKVA